MFFLTELPFQPIEQTVRLARTFFYYAWWIPFHVDFFFFPFTFGHLIYGSMVTIVGVHLISKMLHNNKWRDA